MLPATYLFTCPKGATFAYTLTLAIGGTPVDLSTYSAEMQVRANASSSTTIVSLTNGAGITLGADGTIALALSATATAAITAGTYEYDLYIKSAGGVQDYILKGQFTITASVSQ